MENQINNKRCQLWKKCCVQKAAYKLQKKYTCFSLFIYIHGRYWRFRIRLTFFTNWNFLWENRTSYCICCHFVSAFCTCCRWKWPVAFNYPFDICASFQSVDVLCVISEQLFVFFQKLYKPERNCHLWKVRNCQRIWQQQVRILEIFEKNKLNFHSY